MAFNPIRIDAHNPGPMTGPGNNTYLLLDSTGEAVLIDAGAGDPRHLADIEHHLAGRRLGQVLVTHAHDDHASGAPALALAHPHARFRKVPWPDEDRKYPVRWESLRHREVVLAADEPLVVLHTPGHSPDHMALWHEPSRTVFTGDLVTAGSSVMIQASKGGDLRSYLAALELILTLEPLQLLPAHGPAVTQPAALLRQYLDHRRDREQHVIAALAAGRDTVQTIAEYIYHGLEPALMPAARENVRAHLDKLKADGAAYEQHGRWTP